jgi:hypothetical protein
MKVVQYINTGVMPGMQRSTEQCIVCFLIGVQIKALMGTPSSEHPNSEQPR